MKLIHYKPKYKPGDVVIYLTREMIVTSATKEMVVGVTRDNEEVTVYGSEQRRIIRTGVNIYRQRELGIIQ